MRLTIIVIFLFISIKGHAACVEVALLDDAGSVVGSAGLVIAIKIDSQTLVYFSELPKHTEKKEIGIVECPREVRETVEGLYNTWCRSPQSMKQVAIDNQQEIRVVKDRCLVLNSIMKPISKSRKLF